jgi:hypothetical protein
MAPSQESQTEIITTEKIRELEFSSLQRVGAVGRFFALPHPLALVND